MERIARDFLKAVRGKRSQVAFSRRLGFRSNVCAKWESGSRMPSAALALRACSRAGIDVFAAAERFRPAIADHLRTLTDANVAKWLEASRGEQPLVSVAQRAKLSRYRVARFLSGETRPRLPEFFTMIEALTGRLADFVGLLVDIESVPGLRAEHARRVAVREAVYAYPWSSAVVALLDTEHFKGEAPSTPAELSRILGISPESVTDCLTVLMRAGVVQKVRGRYRLEAPLVIDTRAAPQEERALRQHWALVSRERLKAPLPNDAYSFSVFAVSRADYASIRKLQIDYYQRLRALIANSSPSEVVGLVSLHLVQWDPSAT